MYRRILIATDGSRLSRKAAEEGIALAKKAKVEFKGVQVVDYSPADSLVRTAKQEKCELIVMASHGRRGISRLLLGSETNHVLTRSRVPVLVVR